VRKTFSGKGAKKAAAQWRAQATTALARGALRTPTRRTFREEATNWQRRAEAGEAFTRSGHPYKPGVVRLVAADCRKYLNPAFGSSRLGAITRRDVQALVDRLRAERDDDGEAKHSASKVRSVVTSLKIVLRRPLEDDEIQDDPTTRLRLPPPPESREWEGTPERVAALVAALPEELRALYATAAYAGLRRGELLALRVENLHELDDADGEAWLEVTGDGNWDAVDGRVTPKSSAGVRVVPVPATLRAILLAHTRSTLRSGAALAFGKTASAVFDAKGVQARADRAFTRAEIERVTLHELRHAYRSFLGDCGIPEERSDRYLGHSSGRASRVGRSYSHRIAGQLAADAATLEAYLQGESASVTVLRPWRQTGARTGASARKAASLSGT
jgi:integrase